MIKKKRDERAQKWGRVREEWGEKITKEKGKE